jgi:beta-aspartyl-peptidase (threonine type)
LVEASTVWALIVHGGAKQIPDTEAQQYRAGALRALVPGRDVLAAGGSALRAVEAAVRALEGDPLFNAGYGSVVNADGEVELDAAIMEGRTLNIGAVAAAQGLKHPVSVARALLDDPKCNLVAGGAARRFAEEVGQEVCRPEAMIAPAESLAKLGADTVGAVALDISGAMAVALSTGGLTGKRPGRVGDSPLPGCGFYVDDSIGGVAASGDGESIARVLLAGSAMTLLESQSPQDAAEGCLERLQRVGGEAGVIVLDRRGRFGCSHTSPNFTIALASSVIDPVAAVHLAEIEGVITHDL